MTNSQIGFSPLHVEQNQPDAIFLKFLEMIYICEHICMLIAQGSRPDSLNVLFYVTMSQRINMTLQLRT